MLFFHLIPIVLSFCNDPLSLLRASREFGLPISPWCAGFMPEFSMRVVGRVSNRAVSFFDEHRAALVVHYVNFSPNFAIVLGRLSPFLVMEA